MQLLGMTLLRLFIYGLSPVWFNLPFAPMLTCAFCFPALARHLLVCFCRLASYSDCPSHSMSEFSSLLRSNISDMMVQDGQQMTKRGWGTKLCWYFVVYFALFFWCSSFNDSLAFVVKVVYCDTIFSDQVSPLKVTSCLLVPGRPRRTVATLAVDEA